MLANDRDADGDALTVSITSPPSAGSASVVANNIEFTPPSGTTGTYTINYAVTDGSLAGAGTVTFDVQATASAPAAAGDVVITEIMDAPGAVSDADGEWFEVHNPGAGALELDGCTFSDDVSDTFTVGFSLRIEAGGYASIARSRLAGFVPNYVWDSTSLENGTDQVVLTCNSTEIDRVNYDDTSTFPNPTGASMSLDPTQLDATANDDGANWCESTSTYGAGDLGTPGASNDSC